VLAEISTLSKSNQEESMPSFDEIVAVIVSAILFAVASGHGDLGGKKSRKSGA